MITTEETIQSPPENLQQQTEAEYDATVRADIELFRSYAEKFVAGEINDDQFRAQRLRRGIYSQRQAGVQMIRTKVPGGNLTAAQMDQLALIADEFGGGKGSPHYPPEHPISLRPAAARAGACCICWPTFA